MECTVVSKNNRTSREPKKVNDNDLLTISANEYVTQHGKAVCGDALSEMPMRVSDQSLDLIITSPPYALVEQKSYGNESEETYGDWFMPFAHLFKRKLKPQGSLVINWGGAWRPKSPERSLYIYRLLLRLHDEVGLHLCQEFYWYNPAKLPAPIEWVNKKRIRVKDSIESIFWFSPGTNPKANNRNVLMQYSESMKRLLKTRKYNWGERPSGHVIGKKWDRNRRGAIPPNLILPEDALLEAGVAAGEPLPSNLLVQANTSSASEFYKECRKRNIPIHPARFPPIIPEFFIRFLSDEGDMVCDPFAGSNTTGALAETLNRRWLSIEIDREQFLASSLRFRRVRWLSNGKAL